MREGFFHRRLFRPIFDLLRQGVTPEKIALSVALGAALGVLPALGWSEDAVRDCRDPPAVESAGHAAGELFYVSGADRPAGAVFRWGERLFGAPHFPISVPRIYALFHARAWLATSLLWTTIWHAMVVWGILAPVFVALLYVILTPLLRRALRREANPAAIVA
jgi:hypothetical protein